MSSDPSPPSAAWPTRCAISTRRMSPSPPCPGWTAATEPTCCGPRRPPKCGRRSPRTGRCTWQRTTTKPPPKRTAPTAPGARTTNPLRAPKPARTTKTTTPTLNPSKMAPQGLPSRDPPPRSRTDLAGKPMSTPPPKRPSGRGPGRRPPAASRARHGGSATPMPADGSRSASANGGQSPGRGPARRPPTIPPRGGEQGSPPSYSPESGPDRLPPSIPPGGGADAAQAPDRTRVMPADHPARQQPGYPGAAPPSAPPPAPPSQDAPRPPRPRRRRRRRPLLTAFLVLLVLLLAWPVGLLIWANSKIQHVDVGQSDLTTSGTTYLLAGSDSRAGAENFANDPTEGPRADTIR